MSRTAAFALLAVLTVACDTKTEEYTHTTKTGVTIREVHVEIDSGAVKVTAAGQGQVKSTAVAIWSGEEPTVDFRQEGTLMYVNAICGRTDACKIDLSLEVPPGAELFLDSKAADVSVTSLAGPATITSESGNIELTKLAGTFDVSTQEGAITGTELASESAKATADHSAITLDFSGDIKDIWTETVRGAITLTVPPHPFVVEAKTANGEVDVGILQTDDGLRSIHAVATEAGDISIQQRD